MAIDYSAIIKNPNATEEDKRAALELRGQKEVQMRADGSWNNAWEPTKTIGAGSANPNSNLPYGAQAYLEQIDKAKEQSNVALGQQTEAAVGQQNALKAGLNQNAAEQGKQAWKTNQLGNKGIPQKLAALGITGGESESIASGRQMNYETLANDILKERDAGVYGIDQNIANIRNQGLGSIAANEANFLQTAANRNLDLLLGDRDFDYRSNQDILNQSNLSRQLELEQQRAKENKAGVSGEAYANITGDYDLLGQSLGWTPEQIKKANDKYAQSQMGTKSSGGQSGTTGGTTGGTRKNNTSNLQKAPVDNLTALYQAAKDSGNPESYIRANGENYGIPYNQVSAVATGYEDWSNNAFKTQPFEDKIAQDHYQYEVTYNKSRDKEKILKSVENMVRLGVPDREVKLVLAKLGVNYDEL